MLNTTVQKEDAAEEDEFDFDPASSAPVASTTTVDVEARRKKMAQEAEEILEGLKAQTQAEKLENEMLEHEAEASGQSERQEKEEEQYDVTATGAQALTEV